MLLKAGSSKQSQAWFLASSYHDGVKVMNADAVLKDRILAEPRRFRTGQM